MFPAYDYVLKCSHTFNLLDASGAISVTERTGYITRVRNLARRLHVLTMSRARSLVFRCLHSQQARKGLSSVAKDLLLEIGLEEVPARFVRDAARQLKEKTESWLRESRIDHPELFSYATPRRLAVVVKQVAEKQQDVSEENKGPAKKIALDDNGAGAKQRLALPAHKVFSRRSCILRIWAAWNTYMRERAAKDAARKNCCRKVFRILSRTCPFPRICAGDHTNCGLFDRSNG